MRVWLHAALLWVERLTAVLGCKKGSRECIYPDPPPGKGSNGQNATTKEQGVILQQASPASSGGTDELEDGFGRRSKLDTIRDIPEEEYDEAEGTQTSAATASFGGNPKDSPAASTETSSSHTATARITPERPSLFPGSKVDWTKFSPDVQRYMRHYHENITCHHYCLPYDGDGFFHTILPNFASRNEALLNALVGFAAYHYNIEHNPNGKIQEFLQYYNRSVTLLISFLKRREKPDVATLLTILQLATIEVLS